MFHKITPKIPGLEHIYRGPYGTVAIGRPTDGQNHYYGAQTTTQVPLWANAALTITVPPLDPGFRTNSAIRTNGNIVSSFNGTGSVGNFVAASNVPCFAWVCANAAANAGTWDVYVDNTGLLHWRTLNDAGSATDFLQVQRSGAAPTSMSVLNAGFLVGAPTGGSEGAGTVNVSGGYYVNGVPIALTGVLLSTLAANENRTTTTVSSDSALSVSIPAAGTYVLKFTSQMFQSGATAAGANLGFHFTGTTNGKDTVQTLGKDQNDVVHTQGGGIGAVNTIDMSIAQFHTFTSGVWMDGVMYATSAGTLSVTWGQNTSSGTTTIAAGAALMVARIA